MTTTQRRRKKKMLSLPTRKPWCARRRHCRSFVVTKVQVEDASLSCCAPAEGWWMFSCLCRSCIVKIYTGEGELKDEVSMTPLKKREESRERREEVWVQQRYGVSMGNSDEWIYVLFCTKKIKQGHRSASNSTKEKNHQKKKTIYAEGRKKQMNSHWKLNQQRYIDRSSMTAIAWHQMFCYFDAGIFFCFLLFSFRSAT